MIAPTIKPNPQLRSPANMVIAAVNNVAADKLFGKSEITFKNLFTGAKTASAYPKTKIMIICSVNPKSPKKPSCQYDKSLMIFREDESAIDSSMRKKPVTNVKIVSSNTKPIGVNKDFKMFLVELLSKAFIV